MITVIRSSKKKRLYQWDLDRQIKIVAPEGIEVNEAHFAHLRDAEALVVKIKNVEGGLVADVPNILLQSCEKIRVWLVSDDKTIFSDILIVIQRAKPVDYVYTETEIKNYDALEKRIKALEENGGSGGNGKPGADGFSPSAKVEETAEGAVITITDKEGTTEATVKNGKDGADGYTPQKGIDYFDGKDGADGKTAYQYAKDGGYTGTEEEFAKKLAAENITVDSELSKESENPVQNKVVSEKLGELSEEIADLKENGTGGTTGTGLSAEAKGLLITILKNAVYSTNQSNNIILLENALATGSDDSGGEDSGTEATDETITQSGNIVIIGKLATLNASQTSDTITIS